MRLIYYRKNGKTGIYIYRSLIWFEIALICSRKKVISNWDKKHYKTHGICSRKKIGNYRNRVIVILYIAELI